MHIRVNTTRLADPRRVPDDLRAAWAALAERCEATLFGEPAWVTSSWHHYGRGPLTLVTARAGDRLVGVVPLQTRPWLARTLDHDQSFGPGVLVEDDAARPVADWLFDRYPRVELHQLAPGSAWADAVERTAERRGHDHEPLDTWAAPWLPMTTSWAKVEAGFASSLRKSLRRRGRRLDEQGHVTLSVHDGHEDLDRLLAVGYSLESSGWKATAGTALTTDARARAFYRDVAEVARARGWLRLLYLRVDGNPIAFQLAVLARGRMHLLKTGYDPAWAGYGPGAQLMHHQLQWAHREEVDVVEFEGRAEDHKLAWGARTRPMVSLRWYAPGVAGRTQRAVARGRRRTRRGWRQLRRRGKVAIG